MTSAPALKGMYNREHTAGQENGPFRQDSERGDITISIMLSTISPHICSLTPLFIILNLDQRRFCGSVLCPPLHLAVSLSSHRHASETGCKTSRQPDAR